MGDTIEDYEVGSRVRDTEGFRGTVHYIGPVAAAKNQTEHWLGVEWDKEDRGKHDGSCVDSKGVLHRYFTCTQGAGSFVKPSKLASRKSFCDALKSRYVSLDAPQIIGPDNKIPDSFVTTAKGNQKPIEFLGEVKIRKWKQIAVIDKVAIRDDNISSIGDDVVEMCGHFTEIDLQDNLLHSWVEISRMCGNLTSLTTILLHGNKLLPFRLAAPSLNPTSFANIRTLAINSCGITSWSDIQALETFLPNIEELYIAYNTLGDVPDNFSADVTASVFNLSISSSSSSSSLSTASSGCSTDNTSVRGFANLRVLDISSCKLERWTQVLSFKSLPKLQELVLDGNDIPNIGPSSSPESFSRLQRLSITRTKLQTWGDIDAISTYSGIKQLRMSNIPLFVGRGASEVRPKVIARIKNLEFFNGSVVSQKERHDSEKAYLLSILRERAVASTERAAASSEASAEGVATGGGGAALCVGSSSTSTLTPTPQTHHPRFEELSAIFDKDILVMMGKGDQSGLSLAAGMIQVTFFNMSVSGGPSEPVTKKIPSSVTISRLKLMVKQIFNISPHIQLLSIRQYKGSDIPTLLDDDQESLSFYGGVDGAEIYINEDKERK